MSDPSSSSSSAPPSRSSKRSKPAPPQDGNGAPASIQALIPPIVSVKRPANLYYDVPHLRCFSWYSQTPREEVTHTQSKTTVICWRKLKPPQIKKELQSILPMFPTLVPRSKVAPQIGTLGETSMEEEMASDKEIETKIEPTELPFLRDRYFEVNVLYGPRKAQTGKGQATNLYVDRYENGHFKDFILNGAKQDALIKKPLHYEFHDGKSSNRLLTDGFNTHKSLRISRGELSCYYTSRNPSPTSLLSCCRPLRSNIRTF